MSRNDTIRVTSKTYEIAGNDVRISWKEPATGELLTHILGRMGFLEAEGRGEAPLSITFDEDVPPYLAPAVKVAEYDYGVRVYRSGSSLFFSDGHSTLLVMPAGFSAKARLDPDTLAHQNAVKVTTTLLVSGVLVLLRHLQAYPLHAAGLSRGDVGILLAGPSGSGKSTMAYCLVCQGWGYLSDDTILLKPRGDIVDVFPLRRNFGLHIDGVVPFSDRVIHGSSLDKSKRLISMEQSFPGQGVSHTPPRVIFFPEIVHQPVSRIEAIEKREVMHRLMSQSALLTLEPHLAARHLDVLGQLIRQTRHFRLLAGRDLKNDPLLIDGLIEHVLERHSPVAT